MAVIETVGSRWHAASPHRRTGARRGARGTRRGRWARVAVVALTATLVALPVRHAHADDGVIASIDRWAIAYNLSPAAMEARAMCESGDNPEAVNGEGSGAVGLFQIEPQTWTWLLGMLNQDTQLAPNLTAYDPEWRAGYGTDWTDDADAQAHVASWAEEHGYGYLWACAA